MNPITLTCPDCTAAATVDISKLGLSHVSLAHDPTCPRLNRATRRRAQRRHTEE